ncbi:MAG: class I SAM-dependent methyltransferase [Nanoarchaeota archaeon]|nr:class I SAM-dependent methyltransferase [Nanoarchaeota archaeon]
MNKDHFIKGLKGNAETDKKGIKKNVPIKRWNIAQDSEAVYWNSFSTKSLLQESSGKYPFKVKYLLKEWSKYIKINKNTKILQIGCGPEDVINYFPYGKLYSIDPLADFYKKKFKFDYKKSNLIQGTGENLPYKREFFDIVILTNVLDHTHLPETVLLEVSRVLKKNGIFHFENYFYQKRFLQIAKIWKPVKRTFTGKMFNIHHPYTFTLNDLKKIINKNFIVLQEEIGKDIGSYENLEETKKNLKKEKRLTVRIPAMFNLLGSINYMSISKKGVMSK